MTDAERFEAFVREYQDMVFATALRLLGNPADAEDTSQTVFLKAYQRFAELEHAPTVPGWLKTVTTNLCLNHLSRYRARWQFFSEGEGDPVLVAPATEPELDRRDRAEHLERALASLPDHQRVPLVLFHFEEQSYPEIAVALGVSLSKVKTDIHRGKQKLRLALSQKSEVKSQK